MRSILLLAAVVSTTFMVATSCSDQSQQSKQTTPKGPVIWNIDKINEKAERIQSGEKNEFYESLRLEADSLLKVAVNPSVMQKTVEPHPDSGTKHDYMSLSRYTWPDPDSPDGRPYLFLDGRSNPELNNYDRPRMGQISSSVNTLSLVYYISGEQKYADKAISRLRTWFTDEETLMYPNFAYGQIHPGYDDDKGAAAGLLDGFSFVGMLDAVSLLELKGVVPQTLQDSMQTWFADLTEWMMTSDSGIAESNVRHNHSIAYDTQIIRFALYSGRDDIARKVIEEFPARRLDVQVEADGSMPAELARTKAFGYTEYNITHMLDICDMAATLGIDLYPAHDRAIERAIEWILPYSTDQASFPYQQITSWDAVRHTFAQAIFRAAKYGDRERYLEYYNTYRAEKETPLFEFLYL